MRVSQAAVRAVKIAAIGAQGFAQGLWAGVKDDIAGIVGIAQLFGSLLTNPIETAASFARGFKELLGLSWEDLKNIPKTMVNQFLDNAQTQIAWAEPQGDFDLGVYTIAYSSGFITEKVGLAILTGGASAAAGGIVQGANLAVKLTSVVSKIKSGAKLLKAITFASDKVKAVSAVKTRMFRRMSQYAQNKADVVNIRKYLENVIKPCPVN